MLVGNKTDLRHLREVQTVDAKRFSEQHNTFFMETSALKPLNVENAFTEVLTRIYHIVTNKALNIGHDRMVPPRGQTINAELNEVITPVPSPPAHDFFDTDPFTKAIADLSPNISGTNLDFANFDFLIQGESNSPNSQRLGQESAKKTDDQV
ncbi:hypothetical protein M8C21_013665 [Ambrosia artemisiifolia]|uniref:Uncharacterized protein n=1 Tax=Ambrosia artemisiifolia TaxID=4212 RepID=A0AAD5D8P1_AMBAR|nr:hypothetical protein M8C21_013665 [Ambrosia artemisiifolia]